MAAGVKAEGATGEAVPAAADQAMPMDEDALLQQALAMSMQVCFHECLLTVQVHGVVCISASNLISYQCCLHAQSELHYTSCSRRDALLPNAAQLSTC